MLPRLQYLLSFRARASRLGNFLNVPLPLSFARSGRMNLNSAALFCAACRDCFLFSLASPRESLLSVVAAFSLSRSAVDVEERVFLKIVLKNTNRRRSVPRLQYFISLNFRFVTFASFECLGVPEVPTGKTCRTLAPKAKILRMTLHTHVSGMAHSAGVTLA